MKIKKKVVIISSKCFSEAKGCERGEKQNCFVLKVYSIIRSAIYGTILNTNTHIL